MAAWMYYAAEEIPRLDSHDQWMDELADYWRKSAEIGCGATMDAKFDVYLTDEIRRQVVLKVARRVLEKFLSFGETIPISVLESMTTSASYWVHDPPTEGFINASRGLINLLEGKVVTDIPAMPMWVDSQ
jgi:hypothetical protein